MNLASIIGGHGFIGRALANHLSALGWQVWVPEKNDPQLFAKQLGTVFYCAGLTADYLQRPFDTVTAHVSLLARVLETANWQHVVYLSSARVYDGLSGRLDETLDLHLNPSNPRHLYDLSKLMGESLCLQTARASVARLACVYESEQDQDGFLPHLLRQAIAQHKDKSPHLVVDTSATIARDYVHLNDVVSALVALAETKATGIYNVASGENVSNQEIFNLLEKCCDIKIVAAQTNSVAAPVNPAVSRASLSSCVSIEKMRTQFGWNPQPVLPKIAAILKEKVSDHVNN